MCTEYTAVYAACDVNAILSHVYLRFDLSIRLYHCCVSCAQVKIFCFGPSIVQRQREVQKGIHKHSRTQSHTQPKFIWMDGKRCERRWRGQRHIESYSARSIAASLLLSAQITNNQPKTNERTASNGSTENTMNEI